MNSTQPLSFPSSHLLQQQSDTPKNKDELNQYVLMDPKALRNSDKCYKILWKILEIASLVAFTALAVIAVIWTGIVAPIYLPVTSVIFLTLMPVAFKIYSFLHYKSLAHEFNERLQATVCKKWDELPESNSEFTDYLNQLNVNISDSVSAKTLRPLAARFEASEEARSNAEKKIEKINKKLSSQDNVEKLQDYRLKILQHTEIAQLHKIQAAYFLGILRNPYDQRALSDLCQIPFENPVTNPPVIFNRLLAEKFKDDAANVLIIFDGDEKGTTIEQIQKMETSEVTDFLFKQKEKIKEVSA